MDGIILVDKPAGITSAEVVRRIKTLVKPARVGHLGTLDPFATGLLPIMIGEATKLAQFLEGGDKRYEGLIRLGTETDTLDVSGAVTRTAAVPPFDQARLDEIAARFTGSVAQVPPVFSAIKRAGVPLYRLARRAANVEPPPPRRIEILSLRLEAAEPSAIGFALECSPGTYVRALARDIGVALGSAAHLEKLRRTGNGAFSIDQAQSLETTVAALRDGTAIRLIGLRDALASTPEVVVDAASERRLRSGDARALEAIAPSGAALFKIVSRGCLVAVAEREPGTNARLVRVFNTAA